MTRASPKPRLFYPSLACSLLLGCAVGPRPPAAAPWLEDCERTRQSLGSLGMWMQIDDFDGDGEAEVLTRGYGLPAQLGAWDRVDGHFELIAQAPEPGVFLSAYPIEFREQPAIVRGLGHVQVIAWPTLDLLIEHAAAAELSEFSHPLADGLLVSDHRRATEPGYRLDLESGARRPLTIMGRNIDMASVPDGSLVVVFEAIDGQRTLARLTSTADHTYPWPRRAGLRGAAELDGDPQPELIGIRRNRLSIVDWRDGAWRWSKPFSAADQMLVGVGEFDDRPGIDLLLWWPATLASACTATGCARTTVLTELGETRGPVYVDSTGTLTWATDNVVNTLRCDRLGSISHPSSAPPEPEVASRVPVVAPP